MCHLDIKPGNILIDSSLNVKYCDFGLSRFFGQESLYKNVTRVRSTPAYLAPEAIFNLPIETQEIMAVDLWALGCLIYELIFGKPLFYKAKGVQQLGSMVFLLFESQFNELNLPQNVTENVIRDCPFIGESLREIKQNFSWLENEESELWSLISTLLSPKPQNWLDFKDNLYRVFERENTQNFEQNDLKNSKHKKIKKEAVFGE